MIATFTGHSHEGPHHLGRYIALIYWRRHPNLRPIIPREFVVPVGINVNRFDLCLANYRPDQRTPNDGALAFLEA